MNEKNKWRVLIVEDDEFLLDMYALKFKTEGFSVAVARNGSEAFQMIADQKPNIILLDIVLSEMDGFEILQEVKKKEELQDVKVIMLTNLGQKSDVERGKKLGADEYIIKAHFTPSEIVKKVKQVLGGKE